MKIRNARILRIGLLSVLLAIPAAAERLDFVKQDRPIAPDEQKTDVYVSGRNGYHTYRIPALLTTSKGTLLAFCEGRKNGRGDSGDIDLLVKRSSDHGKTWSAATVVRDDGPNTCGNPCPVLDHETGTIWLLTTWNLGTDRERQIIDQTSKDTRRIFVTCSNDDGITWSPFREITSDVKNPDWTWYATGPCTGIQIQNGPCRGRLVIPCDTSKPPQKNTSRISSIPTIMARRGVWEAARPRTRSMSARSWNWPTDVSC
ncbi:MAG TPA: sialidase family protein [Anaerohalosphaeraceae bacterium]|nr:sialidase family protein [Anaerohalosphaeraceae bacterium]HRT52342.1 sialidase family protein [Anaerohalosphaeraceae bacterium]HRT88344.1 sialidase family protein [Anaerohalosphaeraceae bacterium]